MTQRYQGLRGRARNLVRLRQISEVAVRHGLGYFFERHNLWHILSVRRREVQPPPSQLGRHIREFLEELGPSFVKFGQLLSTRSDLLPHEIVSELVKLQDSVPAFPVEEARAVLREDLGLTAERLFESFEPVPIAAASIGQVHRAVLPGGMQVVVKVQRPRAMGQIERDIDLLYQIAELLSEHFGERLVVDPVKVVDEFAHGISAELDYTLEGRNAERFAANFSAEPAVAIPRVFWTHSSRRVLTLEWQEGLTLNQLDFETLTLAERYRLAETISRTWFKQILEDGFFHGDPHPANITYIDPDHIALLDFGIAGGLSDVDLEQGTLLFLDIMDRDIEGVKRRLQRLGVKWSRDRDQAATAALELGFSRYFGASLADIDPAALIREAFDIIYGLHLSLPTRFLVLEKSLLTVEGVVTQIYPDFNVFEVARPYARKLLLRRYRPEVVGARLGRSLAAYGEVLRDYPFQLHDLLEEMRDGELEIKFVHTGLEAFSHKLDILMNRLVVALVAASLGISSSLVAVFVTTGPRVLGMSLWGIPGLVAALFFGVWLMWAIFRSGRM
ncbi:MAG TPA: AarF/UbiB family protein [Thermoleophilia bacterium]|nr:AarF/UbiB family protein [Thermoleophilia bacterium]